MCRLFSFRFHVMVAGKCKDMNKILSPVLSGIDFFFRPKLGNAEVTAILTKNTLQRE